MNVLCVRWWKNVPVATTFAVEGKKNRRCAQSFFLLSTGMLLSN